MHARAVAVAVLAACSPYALADEGPVLFDAASLPFLSTDPEPVRTRITSARLSPDGTTVYGAIRQQLPIDGDPFDVRRESIAWRWHTETGFDVLDFGNVQTPEADFTFSRPTTDGAIVRFLSDGPFGTTDGFWTPDGPRSTEDFTNDEPVGFVAALSADGSTVLSSGTPFSKWSAEEGVRRFFAPVVQGVDPDRIIGLSSHLTPDGSKAVGFSAERFGVRGIVWVHDETEGFSVIESDDSWLSPRTISEDASVIAGQRLYGDIESAAFVWDEARGLRNLTPADAEFGDVTAMTGDGSVIAHAFLRYTNGFEFGERLWIDGLGDFEVSEGLAMLGYDLTGLDITGVRDFSDDGLTALVGIGESDFALIRSSIPAPGGLVCFGIAFLRLTRLRSCTG